MNQAKNPEYRNGRVDIAVEQCEWGRASGSFKYIIVSRAWTRRRRSQRSQAPGLLVIDNSKCWKLERKIIGLPHRG